MFKPENLPVQVGGAYTLTKLLGKGGMALVYGAECDVAKFDFALLIAHHEAQRGETRAQREARRGARYEKWASKPREELEGLCQQFSLPYPAAGKAAVKVMMPHIEQDERFRAEWMSLLAIAHPNLVQVYGGGHDEEHDVHYYAMELLEGILANKDIKELPLYDKLSIVRQAALGLDCLHGKGIIHRDIKPGNIVCMKRFDGQIIAKVADLGIAKDTTRTQQLTVTDTVMGTPYYMSPEQAEGAKNVTAVSDVYSLGATLYYMVCGKAPYSGASLYEVLGRLAKAEPPVSPRKMSKGKIPEKLAVLVERMMAMEPSARPSMSHVVQAIDRYLEAEGGDDFGDARTIMELPKKAAKLSREDRKEFEELLGGPAKGGGGASPIVVVFLLLIAVGIGFLLGPGRKHLLGEGSGSEVVASGGDTQGSDGSDRTDGSDGPGSHASTDGGESGGSGSQIASTTGGDSGGSAGSGSPAVDEGKVWEGELARATRSALALAGKDDFAGARKLLDALQDGAAKHGKQGLLSAARKRLTDALDARLGSLAEAFDTALKAKELEEAGKVLATVEKLTADGDPRRTVMAGRLKQAREEASGAAKMEALRKALAGELAAIETLVSEGKLGEAMKALRAIEPRAQAAKMGAEYAKVEKAFSARVAEVVKDFQAKVEPLIERDPAEASKLVDRIAELNPEHPKLGDWRKAIKAKQSVGGAFAKTLGQAKLDATRLMAEGRGVEALATLMRLRDEADKAGGGAALDGAIKGLDDARAARVKELTATLASLGKDGKPVEAIDTLLALERMAADKPEVVQARAALGEALRANEKPVAADLTRACDERDKYPQALRAYELMLAAARAKKDKDQVTRLGSRMKTIRQTRDLRAEDFVAEVEDAIEDGGKDAVRKALDGFLAVCPGHPERGKLMEKAGRKSTELSLKVAGSTATLHGYGAAVVAGDAVTISGGSEGAELELRAPKLARGQYVLTADAAGPGPVEIRTGGFVSWRWLRGGPGTLVRFLHGRGDVVVVVRVPAGQTVTLSKLALKKK